MIQWLEHFDQCLQDVSDNTLSQVNPFLDQGFRQEHTNSIFSLPWFVNNPSIQSRTKSVSIRGIADILEAKLKLQAVNFSHDHISKTPNSTLIFKLS